MTGKVEAETAIRAEEADRVGVIALIAGTAIIAWSGILVRFLDVGPLAGAAWRMSLAVPALAVWAKVAQRRGAAAPGLRQAAVPLILAGLAFAVDVGSFHLAINGTKVANATFIGNVAPILTVIGGAMFFEEHPPWRVWFALALALLGAWVMAGMVAPSRVGAGDALALVSATAYASYLLIIKLLRAKLDGPTATLWSAAVSAVALTFAALLHGETMIPSTLAGWTTVFLLGLVSHALGQGLTSVAVGRAPVGLVALVILAQPPFSALFAWRVLGEAMTALQIAGGAVILAARSALAPVYGASHDPRSAERNSASMTRMFLTASSIGNSSGDFPEHGARKCVALQRILVANQEFLDPRAAAEQVLAGVDHDFRRTVGRRVEGNVDLDPPRFTDDRHPLMARQLRGRGEGQMTAARKFDNRARQSVGAEFRVAVERRHDTRRLGSENISRRQNGVAADVVEPSAAGRPVAHVLRVEQAVGKESLDRARRADRPGCDQLARPAPLGMVAHHEGLGDQLSRAVAGVDQLTAPRSASSPMGFSHRTCLPASSAFRVQRTCSSFGSGL